MTDRRPPESIHFTSVGNGRTVMVERVRLILALTLTGLVLIALETTALGRIRIPLFDWGAAAPSLGLLFAMAVGFVHGERAGGVAGLLAGWLSDATGSGGIMLLPLLYFLCAYLSGVVGRRRLAHNLPSFAVFALAGGGVECLFSVARAAVSIRSIPPAAWVWRGLIPVWVLTVLFSPLVYGLVWLEWGRGKR